MFNSIQLFSDEILILQLICRHGDLVKPMKLEGFLGLAEVWRYIMFVFMWEKRVQSLKELNSLEFGGKMRWFIDEEEPKQSQRWGADSRQVLSHTVFWSTGCLWTAFPSPQQQGNSSTCKGLSISSELQHFFVLENLIQDKSKLTFKCVKKKKQ